MDLEFDLLEFGNNSKVEIVPDIKRGDANLQLPLTTLPIGLPPLLPDLKEELGDRFLSRINELPVHQLHRVQKSWERVTDPTSLYHTELSPLQTTIDVQRNATTGELEGYKEAFIENSGISAKNSTSMKRAPGAASDGLHGSSTNYPFWPGGLEEPDLCIQPSSEQSTINFETDLLDTPPGLAKGMSFPHKVVPVKPTVTASGVIDLRSILTEDEILFDDEVTARPDEVEAPVVEEAQIPHADDDQSTSMLDDIIKLDSRDESDPWHSLTSRASGFTGREEWAVPVDIKSPVHDFRKRIPDMAYEWPFELDTFQKQAILHLERHENVFVAAHTSAGKTVVAEYAIALSRKNMTRTIYTSPIKALSNQKFRDFKLIFGDVGLVTGDVQINKEAFCLIMTTEILRSMLYNGSDVIRDLEWVIFDEVHYVNDAERGVVWEEVLIMLPQHVNIILLSATVPNTLEFAEWIGRTKKRHVYVVSTTKRPVPLEHYLYTGNSNKTSNELFVIVDSAKTFLTQGYNKALEAKKERASKSSQSYGTKGTRGGNPHLDKNIWLSVIEMLRKKEKLPVVAFTFSKKRINENADNLSSVDLLAEKEKNEVHLFFQHSISKLKGSDKELPQVLRMQQLLKRGIGVHHSGILPILKEVIEMLFQKGLVKVLFATETFAMGVNMPARTVVFDTIRKHDGTALRDLLPGEYIQMAGRAGRRGLDTTGTVIILCKGDVPEMADLHKMMLGKPTMLASQFRLTYTMMLNLLRVEQIRVEDMMKRSFSEFHNQKGLGQVKDKVVALAKEMEELPQVADLSGDLDMYYAACEEYWQLKQELSKVVLSHPQAVKALTAGRVVIVDNKTYQNHAALVLKTSQSTTRCRILTVMLLTEKSDSSDLQRKQKESTDELVMPRPVLPGQHLFRPEGPVTQQVLECTADDISCITPKTIKINADKIIDDVKKRQIPRFKDDPPGQSTTSATQELQRHIESSLEGLGALDPLNDLRIRDMDLVDRFQRMSFLEQSFANYRCVHDPCFMENFAQLRRNRRTEAEYGHLRFLLSDESLQLLPEYQQRTKVLRALKYIDDTNNVQLKGRVACEMTNHELILTELIFNNALTSIHPTEIAALLSCTVFQEKRCSEPELNRDLIKAKETFLEIARRIGEIQKECGLLEPVEDFVEKFRFGLMEVVFEWARGMPFCEITKLTDVQEGIIVRTIQRLDEVLRTIRSAARIIGDPVLYQKMKEASDLIKRDIVFAASLYTQ